jgi:hypothetical protein
MARALILVVLLLDPGGCASTTYAQHAGDSRIRGAFEQPFRDLSVMRENPPDVLMHAAAAPYDLPGDGGCGANLNEIAALDSVLGPDLDAANRPPAQSSTDISALVSGAIGGVLGMPYRSIVRRLSGAEGREQIVRDAIFAGMVRRAFLKGVAHADNCTESLAPASASAAASDVPIAPSIASPDVSEPQPSTASAASAQQPGPSEMDRQTAPQPDAQHH